MVVEFLAWAVIVWFVVMALALVVAITYMVGSYAGRIATWLARAFRESNPRLASQRSSLRKEVQTNITEDGPNLHYPSETEGLEEGLNTSHPVSSSLPSRRRRPEPSLGVEPRHSRLSMDHGADEGALESYESPEVTVRSLADTVKVPVARLLQQMREAGLSHKTEADLVSGEHKLLLLVYLNRDNANQQAEIAEAETALAKADLPQIEDDKRRIEAEIACKEREVEEARTKLLDLKDRKARLSKAEEKLEAAKRGLAEANDHLAQRRQETAEVHGTVAGLEAQASAIDLPAITKQMADVADKVEVAERELTCLKAKQKQLVANESEFQERCQLLSQAENELQSILSEIEDIKAQIDAMPNVDYALRVKEEGQAFHEAVEKLLRHEKEACEVVRLLQHALQHHHGDNDQILGALKRLGDAEAVELGTAIDLSNEVAERLGSLDRCLKALTEKLDPPS